MNEQVKLYLLKKIAMIFSSDNEEIADHYVDVVTGECPTDFTDELNEYKTIIEISNMYKLLESFISVSPINYVEVEGEIDHIIINFLDMYDFMRNISTSMFMNGGYELSADDVRASIVIMREYSKHNELSF